MGVKAFLVGMSFFEVGMLYWLLCGTVLDRKYFQKKEWVIICANIFLIGINMGGNRSLIFFSQSAFIVCIVVACICVIVINGQYKFLRIIIIILYYTFVALVDFFAAFLSMIVLRHEFKNMVYLYANSIMECILFFCVRLIIACCVYQIVKQKFDKAYFCVTIVSRMISNSFSFSSVLFFKYTIPVKSVINITPTRESPIVPASCSLPSYIILTIAI